MMAAARKLAVMPARKPERDPARTALALALNEVVGLERALQKAQQVVTRAKDLRDQTLERHRAASEAALSAREGHAAAMLRSAETGEAVAVSATSRELRIAAADASDDLEAAKSALASAEAACKDAEADAKRSKEKAVRAAEQVLFAAFEPLWDKAMAAMDDLARLCGPLQYLASFSDPWHEGAMPAEQRMRGQHILEECGRAVEPLRPADRRSGPSSDGALGRGRKGSSFRSRCRAARVIFHLPPIHRVLRPAARCTGLVRVLSPSRRALEGVGRGSFVRCRGD